MPKSKKRGGAKKHKQRVKARNEKNKAREKRVQKIQREMFEQIMKEQESGAFDQTKGLSNSNDEVKSVDLGNDSDSDNELEL